ncbi:hypothetical protein LCGC14_0423620 [marine sediment metagenome]|uniref:Uncharacterized protein n=1 Tax=marine sediment metagenome TaxID=412755 RepID=A0A0F9SWC0_9ZZZZ
MTTICAQVIPAVYSTKQQSKATETQPAHICKELADGFWLGTSYCIVHLELVALGKG